MDFSNIRLAGFDLDGTVFTNDKVITKRTERAIAAAIASGILVIPATGRPVSGMPEAFTGIPGVRYLLGSNGAAVYDQQERRFVVHDCMSRETVLAAMDVFAGEDCSFELYMDGRPYISKRDLERADYLVPDPFVREYVRKTRIPVKDIRIFLLEQNRRVEKINLCYPTERAKNEGIKLLAKLPQVKGVCGLPANLELSAAGVDKGTGLLKLAAYLGLEQNQTLGCGDSENDLAMIQRAGIGAAMANADEKIKKAADFVVPYSNEEEGAAWLLEEIIKQKRK